MNRRYPWSILEIDPTSDEREVKLAYARRLKVTRPEDDADAFQRLVEARDEALARVRRPKRARKSAAKRNTPEPQEKAVNDPPEEAIATPVLPKRRTRRSVSAEDVAVVPEIAASQAEIPKLERVPNLRPIVEILESGNADSYFEGAQKAIAELKELSIESRLQCEQQLLQAVWKNLRKFSPYVAAPSREEKKRLAMQREIIGELDSEFGWSQNDRHAVELLGWDADGFPDALQRVINPNYQVSTPEPTGRLRWRYIGWAMLVLFFMARACSQNQDLPPYHIP